MDAYSSEPGTQKVCRRKNLPGYQLMSANQLTTHRNHDGKLSSYNTISIFGMRPPELLGVFKNPKHYFRMCSIEIKQLKNKKMEELLNEDLDICSWIDFLGRLVKIRMLGLKEVHEMVQRNIVTLTNETVLSRDEIIMRDMNICIRNSIDIHLNRDHSINFDEDDKRLFDFENCFLMKDEQYLLPIPVMSNTSPENTVHFLVHIILSMGE